MMEELWHSKLPLKIKIFVWLVHRNRVQTSDNLGRKQWKESKIHQFCQAEESVEHLIFRCPIAVFVWVVLRDGMKWRGILRSMGVSRRTSFWLEGTRGWGCCGFCLDLYAGHWLNINGFIFNNRIISSPGALIFLLISFLQYWMVVSTDENRAILEMMVEDVRSRVPEEFVRTGVG
jgi:hypothetical protein